MKRYYVSVTETLNKVVSVDANNKDEATKKVRKEYLNDNINLNSGDYVDYDIDIEDDEQEGYKSVDDEYGGYYQHID